MIAQDTVQPVLDPVLIGWTIPVYWEKADRLALCAYDENHEFTLEADVTGEGDSREEEVLTSLWMGLVYRVRELEAVRDT